MSWAGSNPFAALSAPISQREQPKPKKNLANAKDASKVHKEVSKPETKALDPKAHAGNNSAKPNRPEKTADRKGRTFPRKPASGRTGEEKRGGKEWGEGRQGKRIEDGEAEAEQAPRVEGGTTAEPRVRSDGERDGRGDRKGRGRRDGGGGGGGGGGRGRDRDRDREIVELTPEEQAALQAEREAELRQMTLEEWKAKQTAAAPAPETEPLKETRKVEADKDLQKLKVVKKGEVDTEWAVSAKKQQGKKGNAKKKELLPISTPARVEKRRDDAREGGRDAGRNRGNKDKDKERDNSQNSAALNLTDDQLFPSLGGKK